MLDQAAIRAILPHRCPMILLDRVCSIVPDTAISAEKSISGSEPCYRTLPEGAPARAYAFPSSLLMESLGQAAAVLWLASRGGLNAGDVLMLAVIKDYRVLGPAFPGDVVRHEVRLDHCSDGAAIATGESWVGQRRIATAGSLLAIIRSDVVVRAPECSAAAAGRPVEEENHSATV
jgi:3-hydroxyacyl-[acyl-carrier-protein] dehydratase